MWYLVLSRITEGSEEGRKAHLQEHMDWLLDAHRAGHILFSGPTPDRGTGIYVMVGSSLEEVTEITGGDPHHIYSERAMEVIEWDAQRSMRLEGPTIEEIQAMAEGG